MLRHHIKILRYFLPKPIVYYSTSITSREKTKATLIQMLSREFENIAPVLKTIRMEDVKNIHFNEWKCRINLMKDFQFSDLECFQMISRYPLLLKIPLPEFENSLRQWFYADLGWDNFQKLILSQPALLEITVEDIQFRVPNLRVYFRSTSAMMDLLMTCPDVMFDHWESVVAKLDYLLKQRGFKMGDVLHSNALSKSLNFIKFRLDLCEKCGVYKQETSPIHKFNKYDRSKHKNPTLKEILIQNSNIFVKTAMISIEEYAVYKDLFWTQIDEDDASDDEDDNDNYHTDK